MMDERMKNYWYSKLAENIKANNALVEHLKANMPAPTPPTMQDKIRALMGRVEDAVRVLRGEAYAVGYDEEEW